MRTRFETKGRMIDASELKRYMVGRWLPVLSALGNSALRDAVDRWERNETRKSHGECPVHGGKNGDAFRLFERGAKNGGADETGGGICNTCGGFSDGFRLLMESNQWDFRTALTEIAKASGYEAGQPFVSQQRRPPTPDELRAQREEDDRRRNSMRKKHQQSSPVHNSTSAHALLVKRYLGARGITEIPRTGDLRAHPGLYYLPTEREPAENAGHYPAMLTVVRAPDGSAVSMHRTWLSNDGGKARVARPRMEVARPSNVSTEGAAIRFGVPHEVLGVAEGIETALSARQALRIPVWSTLNAGMMTSFVVPDGVRKIVVFADKDVSTGGQNAAGRLASRLIQEGRDVLVCLPEGDIPEGAKSLDWNDVLMAQGHEGFEHLRLVREWAKRRRPIRIARSA